MPWNQCSLLAPLQQLHAVLAEPQFLTAFHAEGLNRDGLHVEPWVPTAFTSASGFTKARRVAYSTHFNGPKSLTDLTVRSSPAAL